MKTTKSDLVRSAHGEMFVALHEAVLESFVENRRDTGNRLTPLLSDVLTRMDRAYHEVTSAQHP